MSAEQARRIADRYEIVRPLASGSMGQVYIARHTVTEQLVALKLLHNETRRDPASIERFLREVRVGGRIGHDGVVKVLDAGVDSTDGTPYLAMELLEGESMYDRLQREGITQHMGLQLIAQILEPLAAAHAKGIVHRDLKPENVFIAKRYDGAEQVKILDFGIAREVGSKSATATGVAVGTPYYMSPEQATKPREVGAASDVWAMGVMLYEILCGAVPFDGESVHAVIINACTQPHTDPLWIAPELDPRLGAIIDKCLAKSPAERFQSAGELLAELKSVINDARVSQSLSLRAVKASSVGSGVIAGQKSGARDVALPLAGTIAAAGSGVMRTSGVPGTQASQVPPAPVNPVPVEPARASAPAVQASGSQPIATVTAEPVRRSPAWIYVLAAVLALAGLGAIGAIAFKGGGAGSAPTATPPAPVPVRPASPTATGTTTPAEPTSPSTTAPTNRAEPAPSIAPRAEPASAVTTTPEAGTAPAETTGARRRPRTGTSTAATTSTGTPATASPAAGEPSTTGTPTPTEPAATTTSTTGTASTTSTTTTGTTTARTGTTPTTGPPTPRTGTTTTTRTGTTGRTQTRTGSTTTRPPTKTRRDPGVLTF